MEQDIKISHQIEKIIKKIINITNQNMFVGNDNVVLTTATPDQ